jgi:hypothetical protein
VFEDGPAVHAPVAFVLTEGNDALEARPVLLNLEPYAAWMARGTPTDWATDSALLGKEEKLIPEYSGSAGASAFVQRALDPEWAALTY